MPMRALKLQAKVKMFKMKLNSTKIVLAVLMCLSVLAFATTKQASAGEDIYTDYTRVSFSGGGTCDLYATLTYSFGSYVSTGKYYVKNPKSGYTIYTFSITTKKNTTRKKIWVNGSYAQSTDQPSSSSYTEMQIILSWT